MTTSEYTGTKGGTPVPDDGGVREQAQQAAGTAAGEGRRVASVAQDEARNVAAEARTQVRGLVDQAGQQVDDQTRQQKGRLVDTMNSLSHDLEGMASEQGGMAADLVREVAQRTRSISSHLDQREPRELLDDVRSFARRRPGTFLLGALAAGVVVGRLARAGQAAQSSDGGAAGVSGTAGATGYSTRPTPTSPAHRATPAADVTDPSDPLTTGRAAPSSGAVPTDPATGTTTGTVTVKAAVYALARTRPEPGVDDPTVRTDTDPGTTWTDPSEPGGRA